jgi:small subunit ribosomal protein S6
MSIRRTYKMNKYELMTIYPTEDEKFKAGTDAVRSVLAQFGATIDEEKPYGDRDLTYEVKKQTRGRFLLFKVSVSPAKISEINAQFKLTKDLLKSLFVKIDSKN